MTYDVTVGHAYDRRYLERSKMGNENGIESREKNEIEDKIGNESNTRKQDSVFWGVRAVSILLLFLYFIWAAGLKEFWYDEVATIGFVRSGLLLGDVLQYYQTIEVTNLPLYALIVYGFYHILPPENIWLLLPGILMTLAGVWLLVSLADRTIGRRAAYAVLFMSLFSTTVVNRVALELRAYALLFFAAVLVTDQVIRLKERTDVRHLSITSAAMIILAFSHYFGVLYLAMLGLVTLAYILRDKKKWRMMLPFLLSAAVFFPWFITAMRASKVDTGSFWIAPPTWMELPETVGYLLGGNYLLCILYGISFLWLLYDIVILKHRELHQIIYALPGPAMMAVIFIYSRWINPGGGLYENRYFIAALPCILLTASYGIERFIAIWEKKHRRIAYGIAAAFLLVSCAAGGLRSLSDSKGQYARYSYAAEQMITEGDLSDQDVLLVCISYDEVGEAVLEGWYDYYLFRNGYEASHLVMTQNSSLDAILEDENAVSEGDITYFRKIYVVGDTDHISYHGSDYAVTVQDFFYKFTVLERRDG